MESNILKDPNVRDLIKAFDLDEPKLYSILIDDYEFKDGTIVINSAKVLDDKMNFIRFAQLDKLVGLINECNVVFNARKQDTVKTNKGA